MAIWNEILEGGLNQLLVRRLAMQQGSPAPACSPEIQGALVLENDRAEFSFLKGEVRAAGYCTVAASPGNFSVARLLNPAGSGVLVVVERVLISTSVASPVLVYINPASSTGVNTLVTARQTAPRDARWQVSSPSQRTAASLTQDAIAALPIGSWAVARSIGGGSVERDIDLDIVLPPGCAMDITPGVVNIDLSASLFWRERGAFPSELA